MTANVQQVNSALVFTYDYHPGRPFQVIASLQQDVVDQILGRTIDDSPVVSDTADYNAFIVNYEASQGGGPGEYFLVFTRDESLQQGTRYIFNTGASFFAAQFNLLEAGVSSDSGN